MYTEATQQIIGEYGKTFTWDVKVQLMGLQGSESAKRIVEIYDLPITWEEYSERATKLYEVIMPRAALMPGTFCMLQIRRVPIFVSSPLSSRITAKSTRLTCAQRCSACRRLTRARRSWVRPICPSVGRICTRNSSRSSLRSWQIPRCFQVQQISHSGDHKFRPFTMKHLKGVRASR